MNIKAIFLFLLLIFTVWSHQAQINPDIIQPRSRVIIDNDFGGDPDGLFQLAHHILSPAVEIKGIIGSIQYSNGFYGYPGNAEYSTERAKALLAVMGFHDKLSVYQGADTALKDTLTPIKTEAAKLIIKEALRTDTDKPLYVVCGAGLTNIASAVLMKPEIGDKITLIWIGGTEYEGLSWPPPGASKQWEYNTGIDVKACQVIFNQSSIPIWQVPRNAYRQALISYAELFHKVGKNNPTGKFLMESLEDLMKRANGALGEAYVLGDSPLVLLTALQSSWEVDPSSCKYELRSAPKITDAGVFKETQNRRTIRVYYDLDIRLMFEDFFTKLHTFNLDN
ncbi:nucleoside hydrolase [Formosa sp. S-31]|uniref:nucleoside hydrolase n=1 Tax=Formosa sp. S-31 TaxID=2790949 RepID=UPI003EBA41F9